MDINECATYVIDCQPVLTDIVLYSVVTLSKEVLLSVWLR